MTFDITKLPRNMALKIFPSETNQYNGSQCWEWDGAKNSKGYGSVTNGKGSSVLAHRKAYEVIVGPIPKGLTIDHLCFNKVCVNTEHLEPVTRAENIRRALAKQTHCNKGHALAGANLWLKRRKNGLTYRVCRTCQRYMQRLHRFRAFLRVSVSGGEA